MTNNYDHISSFCSFKSESAHIGCLKSQVEVKLSFLSTEFFRKCDYKLITQKQPREVSYKKGLLKHFAKFTRKYLCWNLFFNKLANLRPLFNKRLQHRCFLVNFMKFLRIPFLQNTSQPLILIITFLETQFEIDKLLDFCR